MQHWTKEERDKIKGIRNKNVILLQNLCVNYFVTDCSTARIFIHLDGTSFQTTRTSYGETEMSLTPSTCREKQRKAQYANRVPLTIVNYDPLNILAPAQLV